MARVYDALKRTEERQQGQHWRVRWVTRRNHPAASNGAAHLLARLDALEERLSGTAPTASEIMLLERIEAITRRFDALEERLSQMPLGTERQLVAQHLGPTAAKRIARRWLSAISRRLVARTPNLERRAAGLILMSVLLSLAFLFLGH